MVKKILLVGFLVISVAGFSQVPSGLSMLFEEDPTLLITRIKVVIRGGSLVDPAGKSGVASMMSELMLRGTKTKKRTAFQKSVESLGAQFTTGATHDMISFDGAVVKENTSALLALMQEAIREPAFDAKEFANLKKETLAEISHLKNQNYRLGGLVVRKAIFAGTPLEFPTIGTLETVKKITLKDIQSAYHEHFQRNRFIFAVATSVPKAEMEKELKVFWEGFPVKPVTDEANYEPKSPSANTLILIHKPKTSTGAILMAQPGIVAQDPDRYALSIGNFSFGGEPLVSRLFRIVRSELGYTYSIFSTYGTTGGLSNQKGIYAIGATPSMEFTAKTLFKTLELWNHYEASGLETDELRLARESLVNSYPFEFDAAEKRLGLRLSSLVYDVPILTPIQYEKTINEVGRKEIKKAVLSHHGSKPWVIAVVADKDQFAKLLDEEQKNIPEAKRLKISKVISPDDVIK